MLSRHLGYPLEFRSHVASTSCVVHVAFLRSPLRHRLPSIGIARLRWYYSMIRLPASRLTPSPIRLVGHTPFTEEDAGPPELPLHTHVKHAKAYDPGEIPSTLPNRFQDVAFWSVKTIGFPIGYFGAQHLQLLLSACLLLRLRLKKPVARFPPRLSSGGWLGLSGRDSHPLYV